MPVASAPDGWRVRLLSTLKAHAYGAVALPVGVVGLVVAALGGAGTVARWQRTLAHRLLDVPPRPGAGEGRGRGRALRVLGRNLVGLPVNLVAFVLVVPMWSEIGRAHV